MRQVVKQAKWLWVVLLFGGIIFYFIRNVETVSERLSAVTLPRLLLAILLLIGGKFLLIILSQRSVTLVNHAVTYRRMFYINAMSQLAKYLPGGIWHFVGRGGFYHHDGLILKDATRAMLAENVWLLGGAGGTGLVACLLYYGDGMLAWLAAGLVVLLMGTVLVRLRRLYKQPAMMALADTGFLVVTWAVIGLSLRVLVPDDLSPVLAVGAFGLSWAVGYVAIFAPSGIGIREAILVAILAPELSAEASIIYAGVNRLVWVLTELVLGLIARFIIQPRVPDNPVDSIQENAPVQTST